MSQIGFKYPTEPRKTALYQAEEWYQHFLSQQLGRPYQPIKRNNFGHYSMAVNYLTSVQEEAKAINKVAVFNIDHMTQLKVSGQDSEKLLNRVLPVDMTKISVGQCKYTLLLTPEGTVLDDLILMKLSNTVFILVINAGHDITDKITIDNKEVTYLSDGDYINSYLKDNEQVEISDVSEELVKIDVQGPYSYKLISSIFGKEVLKNPEKPKKNMSFFTFNRDTVNGSTYYFSRTGYTNRWGWEIYIPAARAESDFKRIVEKAYELGGLLVGLGGRDENRISAGPTGLPLYGHEYDRYHMPTNAPLFDSAIDIDKTEFIGKDALMKDQENRVDKKIVLFITEGLVQGKGIYKDGKRLGTVTSSINSPNIPLEKRLHIGSKRKSVNGEEGIAAIGLGWLYNNPFELDEQGKDILKKDDQAIRIDIELYRENDKKEPIGKPIRGFISGDGVNPATSHKPLKLIQDL